MRIIISGDGDTGTHLAKMLSVENQDVILMGADREHLAELDATCNFMTFEGSALSRANLLRCGIAGADLFVAVTPDEKTNILSCGMAKDCGAGRTVARIDTAEFADDDSREMFRRFGVDDMIYPERQAALEAVQFIRHSWVSEWLRIHRGELFVIGVRMASCGTLCGKHLRDVTGSPRKFHVAAIKRGGRIIIPRGDDVVLAGDTLYFSVLPDNVDLLPGLCGRSVETVRNVMISGAGKVTETLLGLMSRDACSITVIDPDKERCALIASRFPKTVVVNAPANDVSALKEEGIGRCDAFLALTGSSETNIVSSMVAREHGVPNTLARIEQLQYLPEAESLSIGKIVNKKLLNAGRILNILLDTNVATSQCISIGNAEICEMVVHEGSRLLSRPISELPVPREITVCGVIRDGVGMLAEGRTVLKAADHIVVLALAGSLHKLEKLFSI